MSTAITNGGAGLSFNSPVLRAYNRTGSTITRGQLVKCDTALSSTEATGFIAVDSSLAPENDGFANVVVLDADDQGGIYGIALEDVADDKVGRFQIEGLVRIATVLVGSAGSFSPGLVVGSSHANSTTSLHGIAGNTERGLALTLETISDGTTATDVAVYFNGFSGIGTP